MSNLKLVAEIGINHNGDVSAAFNMIYQAKQAGFDYVKFQKRDPDSCVPEAQKGELKEVPWRMGPTSYLQYKKDIEFSISDYEEIAAYCKVVGIKWFVSVWDMISAMTMTQFNIDLIKIPSACLTDHELILYCKKNFERVMVSTGMSTQSEINEMYEATKPQIVMHTNACYPTDLKDINLGYITRLDAMHTFPRVEKQVGYSNHCPSELALYAATKYPIDWMEMHVTMDKSNWGSDQQSSFELSKLKSIIDNIRTLRSIGYYFDNGNKQRQLYKGEEIKLKTLRGNV